MVFDFYARLCYDRSIKIKFGVGNLTVPNKLQLILRQNGGMVTTAQANEVGVSNERLRYALLHS
jgi:hypothetical protein